MSKWRVISVICFFSSLFSSGQSELISERPGQALSPNCIDKGSIQIQSGLDFMKYKSKGFIAKDSIQTFLKNTQNTVVRFGLGKKFEINSGIIYSGTYSTFQSPIIGFKASVFDNNKNEVSIQYNTTVHLLSDEMFRNSVKIISSHSFTDNFGLGINGGIDFLPESEELLADYVISLSFNPLKKIGIVLESYGNYTNEFKSYWDLGFGYLITPLLQIDTYFGGRNAPEELDLFISGGFTYRLDYANNE